jgi:hypothetical protein
VLLNALTFAKVQTLLTLKITVVNAEHWSKAVAAMELTIGKSIFVINTSF